MLNEIIVEMKNKMEKKSIKIIQDRFDIQKNLINPPF
jgi:hypothetical protein